MKSTPSALWAAVDGDRFIDPHGRHLLLRGVNLGGDCKVPFPDGGTEVPSDFSDHRQVSFIGRPFPIGEADEHLGRLRHWGFNTLRFLVTWEAIAHAGPDQYDADYLDYVVHIIERAQAHDLIVFIDFHQDVWSRMSGGSGAPGWTFEALGLDIKAFAASGGALVMQQAFDYTSREDHQKSYPLMSWASNYQRPVNGIMWTAFFAGSLLTPNWKVLGRNVQHFLQHHYLAAMDALAARVRHLPNVVGFDTLNEPGLGWLGLSLSKRPTDFTHLRPGPLWTPLDGLRLAQGHTVRVPRLVRDADTQALRCEGERVFNTAGVRLWMDGVDDPFEKHGAWRADEGDGYPLREDFFQAYLGERISIADDVMAPFFAKVAQTIRRHREDWLVFAELNPHAMASGERFPRKMPPRWVNANHWYDIECLRTKRAPRQTSLDLAARYRPELRAINALGAQHAEPAPTLIGEFGIQFDLDDALAYRRWRAGEITDDVWADHAAPIAAAYDVFDELLASSTQWNYTASNRNNARIGDRWNQEDLSIFSRDQQCDPKDPDSGGRALHGFVRPYVQAAQGRLRSMRYDEDTAVFRFELDADPTLSAPTIVFAPRRRFPHVDIEADAPIKWSVLKEAQRIEIWAQVAGPVEVRVKARASDGDVRGPG